MDYFQTRRFLSSWQLVTVLVLAVALGSASIGGMTTSAAAQGAATNLNETPAANAQGQAADAAAGGQYTIPTGNIDVVWPAGWSVRSQNEMGIILVNAAQTMTLLVQPQALNGETWDQAAANSASYLSSDQGANATVSGPVVTGSGYLLITDGDIGPRMAQSFASSDPTLAVEVFATKIAHGADLTALATEAHGVTVNGIPALQGIEAVIPAATANEATIPPATANEAATPPATVAAAGGQYTISTGNIDVVWPAGWTVGFQNEERITLTNPAQTMTLQIAGVQNTGRTWDDIANGVVSLLSNGEDANVSGPVVTGNGFSVIVEGDEGPLMAVGLAGADPAAYIQIYAINIAPGSDLTALATEAHGVTVNGVPALQGIEAVIPPAA